MSALDRMWVILPLVLAIFAAGPVFAQDTRQECPIGGYPITSCPLTTDSVIQSKINTRLATIVPPDSNQISVNVANGVVTLRGQVLSQADVDMATVIASGVQGVCCVTNLLTVTLGSQRDTAILAHVRDAISRQPYDVSQVEVEVSEGVVRLRGTVDSEYEMSQLGMVAESVEGVVAVQNNLVPAGVRNEDEF